jgi:hypothetical protein
MSKDKGPVSSLIPQVLSGEIRELIESARQRAPATVNSELTLLFFGALEGGFTSRSWQSGDASEMSPVRNSQPG